jgi:hypothetical protein
MTLVGKIFTVLILVMSVAFLMLAVTIFATHRNWRNVVMGTEGQPGLQSRANELSQVNEALRQEIERSSNRLAIEQAARRYALASLQTKLEQAQQQVRQQEDQLAELQANHGTMVTTLETNEENLRAITEELVNLRTVLRDAQQARDDKFDEVVVLTDQLNEITGTLRTLREREVQLLAQVGRQKLVLERHDLDEFTPVVDIPPEVDGIVTAIGDKDLIEISIGSDDGLREGHTLDVFRNNAYLGRIVIRRTEPDRAVAEILKAYRKGIIKRGDRVATKLS